MDKENAQKQLSAIWEVIDKLGVVSHELFEDCKKQTAGKSTSQCNEYYACNFAKTQEAFYNALSVLADRHYELQLIIGGSNMNATTFKKRVSKVKYIKTQRAKEIGLGDFPNCHITASIKGMRDKYWGKEALIVKSGNYYYNVSSAPEIYYNEAH